MEILIYIYKIEPIAPILVGYYVYKAKAKPTYGPRVYAHSYGSQPFAIQYNKYSYFHSIGLTAKVYAPAELLPRFSSRSAHVDGRTIISDPTMIKNTSRDPSKASEETDGLDYDPVLGASRFTLKFVSERFIIFMNLIAMLHAQSVLYPPASYPAPIVYPLHRLSIPKVLECFLIPTHA